MNSSESIKELATALAKAQGKMKMADKSAVNPHFKSKYADLSEVWEACREALTSEGLSVIQGIRSAGTAYFLDTTLLHGSGEWMSSETPLFLPAPANMQHLGSAVTYAKRISLMAIAGISVGEADDDGDANRKDIEVAEQKKMASAADFKKYEANLRFILKQANLDDGRLLEYAKARSTQMGMTGTEFMKECDDRREIFVDEYREFVGNK